MNEQKELVLKMLSDFRADRDHINLEKHLDNFTAFVQEPQHPRMLARVYPFLSFLQACMSSRALVKIEQLNWHEKSLESALKAKFYEVMDELDKPYTAESNLVDETSPAAQTEPMVKKNKVTAKQHKLAKADLVKGDEASRAGDYALALSYYAAALEHNPTSGEALKGHALAALTLDDDEKFFTDMQLLFDIDRLLVRKLTVKWHIKHGQRLLADQALKEIFWRLNADEFCDVMMLLVEAGELNTVREYCILKLKKNQHVVESIGLLEKTGSAAMVLGDLVLAKACFTQLRMLGEHKPSVLTLYVSANIEAFQGSYAQALALFISVTEHSQFKTLDELSQQRAQFGLFLSAMKRQTHKTLEFNTLVKICHQHHEFKAFIDQWLMVPLTGSDTDAAMRIYIVCPVPESLIAIVQDFIRRDEFTRNLISFFTHVSQYDRLNRETFSWSKIDLKQLNCWVEYQPGHYSCGLLAMLTNPHGMKFFFNTPFFHDKITGPALNLAVPLENGLVQSSLSLLLLSPGGRALLFKNKALRDTITTKGLDEEVGDPANLASCLSVLCVWVANKYLLQILGSDVSLAQKISADGFNECYGLGTAMVSPLFLCASSEHGRDLLENNEVIRHKITRQGLLSAIGFAQRDKDQAALSWLMTRLQRPEFQSLVLHHRLLRWLPSPQPSSVSTDLDLSQWAEYSK